MLRGRLLLNEPRSGAWNMALDEALLRCAGSAQPETITLRLYGWSTATLSLGYFQRCSEIPLLLRAALPVVRRPTGGGALVHFPEEVTLSLSGGGKGRAPGPRELVEHVAAALRHALKGAGLAIRLLGERDESGRCFCAPPPLEPRGRRPFLCGDLPHPLDIVAESEHGPRKIFGSAQRRAGKAWLLHGGVRVFEGTGDGTGNGTGATVPPERSPIAASGAPCGVAGLVAPEIAAEIDRGLRTRVVEGLVQSLSLGLSLGSSLGLSPGQSLGFELGDITPDERATANRLLAERYAAPGWTDKT